MMIIESIKKRKGDLIVTFEDHTTMQVEYDIYIKYHLEPSLSMNQKTFKEMQQENAFLFFKRIALKRLSRMMTAYELHTYLLDKGAPLSIAKQIVHDFKKKKYINDEAYTKWYVSSKQFIEGPRLITDKLKQKGIALETIKTYVDTIDEKACLQASINKRLNGQKNKNKHQLKMTLKRYFMHKGFDLGVVSVCVEEAVSHLHINERALLEKEVAKIIRKAKDGIDRQKLIEKLYRKGYRYDDIKQVIEVNNR